MADISHLHPLMQEALLTGKVPSREELARLLGKKIQDIPDPDAGTLEEDAGSAEPEDPAAEAFRARYHAMVAEKVAAWLADEEDRDINGLTDYRGGTVPLGCLHAHRKGLPTPDSAGVAHLRTTARPPRRR